MNSYWTTSLVYVQYALVGESFEILSTSLDIPECSTNNGDCEDRCEETEGSFLCHCDDPGFEVNGTACDGVCVCVCVWGGGGGGMANHTFG